MTVNDINESFALIEFEGETDEDALELRLRLMEDLSVFVDGHRFIPSVRSGIWDGKKNFYEIDTDMNFIIPKGLVESVLKRYKEDVTNFYTPRSTVIPVNKTTIETHIQSLDLPFAPYDYQQNAFTIALNQPRKILVSATGSGKSLMIYLIMTYFASLGKRGLLIVPNIGLAEQMKSDFTEDYKMPLDKAEELVHIIYHGKPRNFNKLMTVTTWQSAILMNPVEFEALDYVLVDEAHQASGESLTSLLNASVNCLHKIGLTGTMPKSYEQRYSLGATLGKTEVIITPQGLIERGLATPVTIVTVYLNYGDSDKQKVKKMKYAEEVKFLEKHVNRNDFIARMVIQATKKYGNSIMMYSSLAHGRFLLDTILRNKFGIDGVEVLEKITPMQVKKFHEASKDISKLFVISTLTPKDKKVLMKFYTTDEISQIRVLNDYHIYLIKGSIPGEVRNQIRKLLENIEDGIVIGSAKTVSTGMNIKRLHNFFSTSSTKSSITLNQSIGRGMRLHKEKDMMRYFDFIDDFSTRTKKGKIQNRNSTLKHSYERLNEYIEHGYPIKEIETAIAPDRLR